MSKHSKEYRAASAQMKRVYKSGKSKPSVTREELTPHLSALGAKVKKRRRGKSFEPGNGFGSEHRFKKGVSGNPGGRTKCSELRKALRVKLASMASLPKPGRTFAEKVADKWVDLALNGNSAAIAAIADNAEGRPHQSISVDDSTQDSMLLLVAGMNRMSAHLGPPEDNSPRFLEEKNDDHDSNG
jgi:hypothetical protein